MGTSSESTVGRRTRAVWGWGAAAVLTAVFGTLGWYIYSTRGVGSGGPVPAPERLSPQLAYQGPFLNIHPAVGYVGDAACAACHKEIATSYRDSAMGRSLRPMSEVAPLQQYDESTNNPFELLGYRFSVERKGNPVCHRQTRAGAGGDQLLDFSLEAHYVVGSGTHGYSYLTEQDGFLFQTPISWFSQKGIWDKSPGFEPDRFAGRPIQETCLYCHANHAKAMQDSPNRYDRPFARGHAIGCERCHGPGEKHIQEGGLLADGLDPTIVNPAKLAHRLRQAVSQQCHLQPTAPPAPHCRRFHSLPP